MGTVVTKNKAFSSFQVTTTFKDQSFVSRVSLRQLENSLSERSKPLLDEYRRNLSITRGYNHPNYDYKVEVLLKSYALDLPKVNRLISYLKGLKDDSGVLFSRNLKIYSTTEDAMKRFSLPDYTSFRWNANYQSALIQMKEEFSSLHLNPLVYKNDDDIIDFVPRMDTHSGFTWINTGQKYKGENMNDIYRRYKLEEDQALQVGSFNKPILIGFRTQGSGEFDDEGNITNTCKHKLRVVSMIDLIQIIAELKFSQPLQKYLGSRDYYAGGKDLDEIGRIISGFRATHKNFITLDYSSYDQTISSWLIEDAFDVCRCAFNLDSQQSQLFDVIVHDFIHKQFIINEGVVESHRGVPSGSMFTQIIDSIVNRLMILTYFKSLNSSVKMIIMGDDNTLFTNADVDLDLISTYIGKNFGIQVNTDKSTYGKTLYDKVEFLSCYWLDHGRWRPPEILLSRLLFSERFRKYGKGSEFDTKKHPMDANLVSVQAKPELVLWAYLLTYPLGMNQLIDVKRFRHDYPLKSMAWMDDIGDAYLPGALVYLRRYTSISRSSRIRNNRRWLSNNTKVEKAKLHHQTKMELNLEIHNAQGQPHLERISEYRSKLDPEGVKTDKVR